jgi:hypothetical protein
MKWTILPPVLMAGGLLLIIAGFAWTRLVGNAGWSEEKAQRLSTAGADVHRLQYEHAFAADSEANTDGGRRRRVEDFDGSQKRSADRIKAELDQAHEEWDRSQAELNRVRKTRRVSAAVLWGLGIASCLLGVAGYFVLRTEWAQQYVDE